jgi:RNA polymerase-binding transcription factor DksA
MDRSIFEAVLNKRRRDLIEEIREQLARSGEAGTLSPLLERGDEGDDSFADIIADMDISMVTRDVDELRDVEAARMRLADGTYGVCGDEIAGERMLAYPTAKRCIICQTAYERRRSTTAPARL